jgi:hypothetical protein
VGPRAGLDAHVRGKILCLCRGSNLGRPVHSQTLHRLSKRRRKDIKMDFRNKVFRGAHWIHVALDTDQRRAFEDMITNLQVPRNAGKFLAK